MNLQIFSFYITLRMQTSKQTSLFRKSVSKYPSIWGTPYNFFQVGHYVIFLFTALTTKWPWEKSGNLFKKKIWNHMTGRKKLEIGSIFPYFVPPVGTPTSLFRLFANATHKIINHARRNLTFTCKITPRVNFYYLLWSKFLACIR